MKPEDYIKIGLGVGVGLIAYFTNVLGGGIDCLKQATNIFSNGGNQGIERTFSSNSSDELIVLFDVTSIYGESEKTGSELNNLGNRLNGQGEYAEAEKILLESIEKMPNNPAPYLNLGDTYSLWGEKKLQDGKIDAKEMILKSNQYYLEALELIDEYRKNDKSRKAIAYAGLGCNVLNLGDKSQALKYLTLCADINPNNKDKPKLE